MQYSVAKFAYEFAEPWQQDVFEQTLGDIGFECFDGERAYIQTAMLDNMALERVMNETNGARLLCVESCPDENWNATWEEEHGEQVIPLYTTEDGNVTKVVIRPHCAFGAGYHETTSMMVEALKKHGNLKGKRVLDNGCGTGILGIVAAKYGAVVTAVDIDEYSVTNTKENAETNGVDIDARLADKPAEGKYDLILSNIHRNILLKQMPLYKRYLNPGGELWLSGFYEKDCPTLIRAAEAEGMTHVVTSQKGEWRMIKITN